MRVVLMGPPGAGKGTQAGWLASSADLVAISTGELFRMHIRTGTALGTAVASIVDSGGYVPDELTNAVVRERIGEPDAADGFVLDGYPRTLDQVAELDAVLAETGTALDAVVRLDVADDEVVERLTMRRRDAGRADDAPDVLLRRLATFHAETAPLFLEYERRGLLITVDGARTPEEVARLVVAGLRASAR